MGSARHKSTDTGPSAHNLNPTLLPNPKSEIPNPKFLPLLTSLPPHLLTSPPLHLHALPYPPPVDADPTSSLRLAPGLFLPESLVEYSFSSSSGPGGQNVNKRATRCQLRVRLADLPLTQAQLGRLTRLAPSFVTNEGDLLITADEHRSQGQNKAEAEDRLKDLFKRALIAPKPRRPTKPSRGSKERRLTEKKVRGEIKRRRRDLD